MPTVDYEAIFENAEVGIALNDYEAGTVGDVNERYADLMGYSREELREMPIEEISADDPAFDREAAMEKIQQAIEGDRKQFDWLFERKDGSRFWAEVVLKRTRIGPDDRLLAFVRDISDRKRYERELERKNERLDEFASIVSHDLQSPLNVAEGRLELARAECDSDHLEAVAGAHARMRALIDELLALARAGATIGEREPVSIGPLARQCWQDVERGSAELVVETDRAVRADRPRLQQLLGNLLRNAVDHGGEDVTVAVGTSETTLYVEDDGPGIPAAERDDVFEAGYSTAEEGTGFGLNIVKQVAQAHNWDVRATDGSEGGARFEVTGITFAGG